MRERPDNTVLTSHEGSVKHVEAGLSARDDQESSFHYCGGPVKLV